MKIYIVTIDSDDEVTMNFGVYSNKALAGNAIMEAINYKYWYDVINRDHTISSEMYYEYVTDMWDDGISFIIKTINRYGKTTWYSIESATLNE